MPFILKTKGYSIASKINQQTVPKSVEPLFILPKPIIIIPNDNLIKVEKINISAKKISPKKVFVYKPPFILPKNSISQFTSSNLENDTNISNECTESKDNNCKKSNLEDDTLINTKCIVREDDSKMADLEIDTNNNSCLVREASHSDSESNTQLNTNCESNQDFIIKENDELNKVVTNKSSENMNSKSKLKRRLDEVIMKPLLMVNDKSSENGKCDSVSSINFINNKCYKYSDRNNSMDECDITSPKKKKISRTIDYFSNHAGKVHEKLEDYESVNHVLSSTNSVVTKSIEFLPASSGKDCNIVIKSEVVEEIGDSSQEAYSNDCKIEKISNSCLLEDCSDKQKPHFAENKIENKSIVNARTLSEMTPNTDKYNQNVDDSTFLYKSKIKIEETSCKISKNVNNTFLSENCVDANYIEFSKREHCDIIIKSEIIEEICDSSPDAYVKDCETEKVPNFSSLNEHSKKQHSTFIVNEIENRATENVTNFFEISKVVLPHYLHDIKQEMKDDFEIAMTNEYVHDINTNKYNMLTKNESKYNIHKQDVNNIKYILNNNQVNKTIDYFPDPNDKQYGIIIKSEITEDNDSEDVHKIDFNLVTLPVDSNSVTKDLLTKRKLISDTLSNMNKTNKVSHDNFHTITEFPKLNEQHDFYPMQKLESNNKINNIIFIEDVTAYKGEIPIKSEIVHDNDTLLPSSDDVIQKEIVLKRTRSVTKSNSLERAHLKISSRKTTPQSRSKQKCHTKRKISKRKKS